MQEPSATLMASWLSVPQGITRTGLLFMELRDLEGFLQAGPVQSSRSAPQIYILDH